MSFTRRGDDFETTSRTERHKFRNEAALADAWLPYDAEHRAASSLRAIHGAAQCIHLAITADQGRLRSVPGSLRCHRQQAPRWYRLRDVFDPHHFGFAHLDDTLDETGGRRTQHDSARRCDRLHPLCHSDMGSDCRVTAWGRTHFARNHLARVQSDPQVELNVVTPS